MKVRIEDTYDSFNVYVLDEDGEEVEKVRIDQEDSREELKKIFEKLGVEVEYEEVY